MQSIFANGIAENNKREITMSQITVNNRVYNIHKTYEAALGIVVCFIEMNETGERYTMMLTPEGDWRFTGSQGAALKEYEQRISDEITRLTCDYPICYS